MVWRAIAAGIGSQGAAVLVSIVEVKGSAPRDAGARMVVTPDGRIVGTIGGGALEFAMMERAGTLLKTGKQSAETHSQALGPDLGQCCGGQALIRLEMFDAADRAWIEPLAKAERLGGQFATQGVIDAQGRLRRALMAEAQRGDGTIEHFGVAPTPVMLFGAGHVGRALVLALAPLPFVVQWVDARAEMFPAAIPGNVTLHHTAQPERFVASALPGTLVVVMTHSHPLDLANVLAALGQENCAFVGLIGSETKKARFHARIRAAGVPAAALDRLACPIGGRRLADKTPAVIAASIAVVLLEARERYAPAALP